MGAPQTVQLKDKTKNVVNVLHPYRNKYGIWAFDDPEVGLQAEPFVGSINTMIDSFANGKKNITVYISAGPLPSETLVLDKTDAPRDTDLIEEGEVEVEKGDEFILNNGWYKLRGTDLVGWLCPATLKYFADYPKEIHVKFEQNGN